MNADEPLKYGARVRVTIDARYVGLDGLGRCVVESENRVHVVRRDQIELADKDGER